MIAEIAVGAGHDGVEQLGVVAARDDDPQGPPSQRRHLDGVHRPGHFGGEYALDILIAEGLGRGDHQISGLTGEAGGVGLVGQPGGQAGNEPAGADPLGQNIGVEEVLLHELAESGGELILALDDQRGVRYRQAQGTAEQSGHREPVRDAADHGRLGAGLHVVEESPVGAGHGHGHEHSRYPGEESGRPPARGGQPARPQFHRLALQRGCRCSGHRRGRFHLAAPGQPAARPRWSSGSIGTSVLVSQGLHDHFRARPVTGPVPGKRPGSCPRR